MRTAVLKPGFLVSLKTNCRGGVAYSRIDLEPDHADDDGARVAKWETTRQISNPQEFEMGNLARRQARSAVSAVCCSSSFGLLCPTAKEAELNAAIAEARKIADAHNEVATETRVDVFVLVGRIAQDDAEAARAISAEVRDLIDAMKAGIAAADPTAIREAANKARDVAGMLSSDVAGKVNAAIAEARDAARALVKRVQKAGEAAATVVAECYTARLETARFAFLDLDEAQPAAGEQEPAARGLDLEPGALSTAAAAAPAISLEA